MNPQLFGVAMERLYAAGALEVFYVPVQMKKNRPGTLLTVVCHPSQRTALTDIVFRETTTIGVRYAEVDRECLQREIVAIETAVGPVRIKVARRDGRVVNAAPEFDDCVAIAAARQSAGEGSPGDCRARVWRSRAATPAHQHAKTTAAPDRPAGQVDRDALLSHYRDRLREQPPASRDGVREDLRRRHRALQAVVRHRHAVSDGQRRALAERLQEGGRGRARSPIEVLRSDGAGVRRHVAAAGCIVRRFHPHDRAAPHDRRHGDRHAASTTRATSTKGSTKAGTASAAKRSSRRKISSTAAVRCTRRSRRSGSPKRTIFSGSRNITQPLLDHFAAHPDFLQPDIRRNEILRLLDGGLEDISVSRAGQSWGIPLPWDRESVVYVWFDALINYASAVGLGGTGASAEQFAKWWPADLHVIGKDITRFHAVIWPAMLMSAQLPLPREVFGHGFMTMNGQRMSKSLGTIVDPIEAAERYGADPLRLYLVKEIAFGGDGDFSWERYDERYNVDLANNLGNLVSRVAAMAGKYRGGRLRSTGAGNDQLARVGRDCRRPSTARAMDRFLLHEGAAAAFRLIDAANEFIAATSPWAMARDPGAADRLTQVLFDAAEAIRLAAVLLTPIMPTAAKEILRRVGVESDRLRLVDDGTWRSDGERILAQDGPLWPRQEKETAPAADVSPRVPQPRARVPEARSEDGHDGQRTQHQPRPSGTAPAAQHPAAQHLVAQHL